MTGRRVLIGMTLAVLAICFLFPVGLLLLKSFQVDGTWGLANYREVFATGADVAVVTRTVGVALAATVLGLIVAVPFAYIIGRTDVPGKELLRSLLMLPYLIPPFVGAIAWTYLANPRTGYLNGIGGSPWVNIYSLGGLVWVLAIAYLPRAFLAVLRALERIDQSLEEAAYVSGASHGRVLRTVTLPLLLPSVLAGGFLIFIAVADAFGIPAVIAVPARIPVITTRILETLQVGSPEAIRQSTAIASALMSIALVVLAGNNLCLGGRDRTTVGGKTARSQITALGPWRWPVFGVCLGVTAVLAVLPVAAILATTFVRSVGLPLLDPHNWTLKNWAGVLTDRLTWKTLQTSLVTAAAASTVSVALGTVIAYLRVRVPGRLSGLPDQLTTLGAAMPGMVVALGLIVAFSGRYGLNLYGTLTLLIMAYVIRSVSLAVRPLAAALDQMHPVLEEAALASGASWLRAMRDIVLPVMAPTLMASWFLVFIPSVYEVTMSVVLYSARTQPVGVYLYDLESYANPQAAAVLSALIAFLAMGGNALLRRISRGKLGV